MILHVCVLWTLWYSTVRSIIIVVIVMYAILRAYEHVLHNKLVVGDLLKNTGSQDPFAERKSPVPLNVILQIFCHFLHTSIICLLWPPCSTPPYGIGHPLSFGPVVSLFFFFLFYSASQCICKRCTAYSNSIRPSIRLSVTRLYCVKTTAHSTVQFALSDSKMCLVF